MYTLTIHSSAINAGRVLGTGDDVTLRTRLAHLLRSDRSRGGRPQRAGHNAFRFSNGSLCRLTFQAPVKSTCEVIPFPAAA